MGLIVCLFVLTTGLSPTPTPSSSPCSSRSSSLAVAPQAGNGLLLFGLSTQLIATTFYSDLSASSLPCF